MDSGRHYGITDVVQEIGRAGRSGEPIHNTVILSADDMQWIRSEVGRENDWNRDDLRFFLNE